MKTKLFAAVMVMAALVTISTRVFAHHAEVVYDENRTITLKGVVTKFMWTNPHAAIHFKARSAEGQMEDWIAEMGPLGGIVRSGWAKDTIKTGDEIEMVSHPHKEGIHRIRFVRLVVNGKVLRDDTVGRNQQGGRE